MKLLFVNTNPTWGGGEKWTFDAMLEFIRRGHEVALWSEGGSPLAKKAQDARISVFHVNASLLARLFPSGSWGAVLSGFGPDIAVANSGRDIRIVNRARGGDDHPPLLFRRGLDKPISDHFFHRRDYRRVHTILTNSEATRRTVVDSFPWFPRERVHTVYNPIDAEAFLKAPRRDVRAEYSISADAFVAGIVGRLSVQKGHDTFLRAMKLFLAKVPDALGMVVGDGELRGELLRQAEELGIRPSLLFVGHVDDVQSFYEACNVIVIPSLYEGFCFTAVEAQLLRKPVIASRTSSLPEIIDDEVTGLLVPVGDAGAICEKLAGLAMDPSRQEELGEAAASCARDKFDAGPIYDQLEKLFQEVARGAQS